MNLFKKRKKNYPDFWMDYLERFNAKPENDLSKIRFVVLDTETTGFDYETDRILSIGALSLQNNHINVNQSLEVYLYQHFYHAKNIQIHGILQEEPKERITELDALIQFLDYIGNSVLVAHHAGFDRTMINKALNRHGMPDLKNKFLDTSVLYKRTLIQSPLLPVKPQYSLDELAEKFDISKKDRHTALGDAYITAIAFMKIMQKLKTKKNFSVKKLLK
ncbi:DNA polymerase-3 subunit epsilon [Zobellia uliginosa]|uniref:DNA polymerase-3 subunit epsilon n=1 Tax=Zobellia uliginosa TaxID=143224 RepID=A0ABY1KQX9_9FLAO|nr:3'-5' exonuclease [Zobellia uliginosa]MDO6518210.1 3'-5' exonuclease [Zobellia uliginosa]SIS52707.1 DNA polymerase-3 subunit epsilon [Zobellia uliginosa]